MISNHNYNHRYLSGLRIRRCGACDPAASCLGATGRGRCACSCSCTQSRALERRSSCRPSAAANLSRVLPRHGVGQ